MWIKLWGVRGSIPTPIGPVEYRHKLKSVVLKALESGLREEDQVESFLDSLPPDLRWTFGGNTTCVTVAPTRGKPHESEVVIAIDAGTGLRALGDELMAGPCGRGKGLVRLFVTHTHWDHIQGLPFFKPLYIPGNEIHFYSPMEDMQARLVRQQMETFFPVPFEAMGATKVFHRMTESAPIALEGGILVDFRPLKHPGGSFAYRFKRNDHAFVFATDCEFTGDDLEQLNDYMDFFHHADLLIIDAQYSLNDSFQKFDWGHTANTMAVNCGVKWKVKNLVLTHHEPSYQDSRLFENYRIAIDHKRQMKTDIPRLFLAREGMVFQVGRD